MDLYFELLGKPVFTVEDVIELCHNVNTAKSAIQRLEAAGRIVRIRRGLYTAISGETKCPVANRFQIASHITPTSALSHHGAVDYYGCMNQVFTYVYVCSETRFKDFVFDGYRYCYVPTSTLEGIECPPLSGGVHVTSKERTVIDSIKDMDKIAGPEEVIENVRMFYGLDEAKMLKYLAILDNKFLYQKTGYILSHFNDRQQYSKKFLNDCFMMSGKSTRYLLKDEKDGVYDAKWRLIVPQNLFHLKNGVIDYADI